MLGRFRNRLSLIDFFHFIYLLFLLTISISTSAWNRSLVRIIILYVALLLGLLILVYVRRKIRNERLYFGLYFWYPVCYLLIIFQSMTWLLPEVNSPAIATNKFDSILYGIDLCFYDIHPVLWFERNSHPLVTDAMYLLYSYYFFMPFLLMVLLLRHKKFVALENSYFILALSFYLGYIGYLLVPAKGPRFYLDIEPLQGVYCAEFLRNLIDFLEPNKHDVFPSMHQLINVVILVLSYRYERKLFYVSLPISIGITTSLMYCQYHYVIDVVAGAFLAILFYLLGNYVIEKQNSLFCCHLLTGELILKNSCP